MSASTVRAALRRLEELTAVEVGWLGVRPRLGREELREALTDGRLDAAAFLANAAACGELVEAEARMHAALARQVLPLVVSRRKPRTLVRRLRVVGGEIA